MFFRSDDVAPHSGRAQFPDKKFRDSLCGTGAINCNVERPTGRAAAPSRIDGFGTRDESRLAKDAARYEAGPSLVGRKSFHTRSSRNIAEKAPYRWQAEGDATASCTGADARPSSRLHVRAPSHQSSKCVEDYARFHREVSPRPSEPHLTPARNTLDVNLRFHSRRAGASASTQSGLAWAAEPPEIGVSTARASSKKSNRGSQKPNYFEQRVPQSARGVASKITHLEPPASPFDAPPDDAGWVLRNPITGQQQKHQRRESFSKRRCMSARPVRDEDDRIVGGKRPVYWESGDIVRRVPSKERSASKASDASFQSNPQQSHTRSRRSPRGVEHHSNYPGRASVPAPQGSSSSTQGSRRGSKTSVTSRGSTKNSTVGRSTNNSTTGLQGSEKMNPKAQNNNPRLTKMSSSSTSTARQFLQLHTNGSASNSAQEPPTALVQQPSVVLNPGTSTSVAHPPPSRLTNQLLKLDQAPQFQTPSTRIGIPNFFTPVRLTTGTTSQHTNTAGNMVHPAAVVGGAAPAPSVISASTDQKFSRPSANQRPPSVGPRPVQSSTRSSNNSYQEQRSVAENNNSASISNSAHSSGGGVNANSNTKLARPGSGAAAAAASYGGGGGALGAHLSRTTQNYLLRYETRTPENAGRHWSTWAKFSKNHYYQKNAEKISTPRDADQATSLATSAKSQRFAGSPSLAATSNSSGQQLLQNSSRKAKVNNTSRQWMSSRTNNRTTYSGGQLLGSSNTSGHAVAQRRSESQSRAERSFNREPPRSASKKGRAYTAAGASTTSTNFAGTSPRDVGVKKVDRLLRGKNTEKMRFAPAART
ncbi:unnamed protein product [Amoebophrya sp. A120]|nr:unnamed protein product [Amoebophrya sp. A120]|eukprot:GSA120T00024077001.1